MTPPDDLIELGRITGAYGLKGWVAIAPNSNDPTVLKKVKKWWISRLKAPAGTAPTTQGGAMAKIKQPTAADLDFDMFEVMESKLHAGKVVAHLQGIEDRNLAEQFKNGRVYVSRAKFPSLPDGEFYWIDLIGCTVVNLQDQTLGVVREMMDHGAHPILVVDVDEAATAALPAETHAEAPKELLIPFVDAHVTEVQMAQRRIVADWQLDY